MQLSFNQHLTKLQNLPREELRQIYQRTFESKDAKRERSRFFEALYLPKIKGL